MKLYSTFNRLSLITLLSLGLVCSPLVASADDGNLQHGLYQKDRGKFHYWADHLRDHRGYQDDRRYNKQGSYSKHKKSHPVEATNIHHGHGHNVQPYRIRRHHNIVVVRPSGQWCL
ncbi:MAG: hypothetical protein ABFS45_21490 [Pseudomonadota bacterium]